MAQDGATPNQIKGVGVGRGAVVAPALLISPNPALPADEPAPADPAQAKESIVSVLGQIGAELNQRAAASVGTLADVLGATAQMALDPMLAEEAAHHIDAGLGPATAVDRATEKFAAMLRSAGGYLGERVTDLYSVRHRAVARLLGLPEPGAGQLTERSVIVAEDLSPADTAALDLTLVAGIVIAESGPTSHTAIIAGQLGLPCVVQARGVMTITTGTIVAVDAAAGLVTIDPSDQLRERYAQRAQVLRDLEDDVAPGTTADGHPVQLLANIGTEADANRASATAVEGVGLFRTEVLFLDQQQAPDVDSQVKTYRSVLQAFAGRKVVVRTLDAGTDKPLAFANQAVEHNPALGVRGFRLIRTLPGLIKDQLTALAEAELQSGTETWVMAPMVATPAEAAQFANLAREVGLTKIGVMIEVPSAALRCAQILDHVDFISIGTNDLAQYTMATDRLAGDLVDLLDMWQPAVLELVAAAARAGQGVGKPVGVCGESAADPLMAPVLCGLGITSLSMSPAAAPAVRYTLRQHTLAQCTQMAEAALNAVDAASARAAVVGLLDGQVRELLAIR